MAPLIALVVTFAVAPPTGPNPAPISPLLGILPLLGRKRGAEFSVPQAASMRSLSRGTKVVEQRDGREAPSLVLPLARLVVDFSDEERFSRGLSADRKGVERDLLVVIDPCQGHQEVDAPRHAASPKDAVARPGFQVALRQGTNAPSGSELLFVRKYVVAQFRVNRN